MAKQYDDATIRNSNNNIKRTGEHVLTWIGVAIQALVAIMFLMIKPFIGNADFKEQIINETQKQGNEVSITEINKGMDALGGLFNFFTWGAFIPLILAIIGGILINKKPKLAGIMLLVRKPKHDMYGNADYNDHYKRDHHDVNANNNAFILNEEEEKQQQRYIKDHYSNKDQAADNNNEREHDTHVNDSKDDDYRDQRYSNHKTNKRSNDFIQDEARKLQEEKDNDPYKY